MRLAIIGAMDKEVAYIKSELENLNVVEIKHLKFYTGTINDTNIVLTVSGIGKVSSGIIIATLLNNFNVDKVINIGVSGGNSKYLKRGDCVIGEFYSYADCDCTPFPEYSYGQIPDLPCVYNGDKDILSLCDGDIKKGMILSGDKFFVSKDEIDYISDTYFKNYNCVAFDMESCALAQGCYLYNVPFCAIRVISDLIGVQNVDDYYDYVKIACEKANKVLFKIIENI